MISGHTQIIAHLGVPMHAFKAPLIYNPWFEKNGIDVVVVPMGCEAEDYPNFLPLLFKLRNTCGALITMPHKVTTVDFLDEASVTVQVCQSCNAVRRGQNGELIGDMFDGEGFVRGVLSKGRQIEGASVLIVGNGGVGSAIAASMAMAKAGRIGLYDPNTASMDKLANSLSRHFPALDIATGSNDPEGWDILVNATPLGMNENDPLPVNTDRIAPETFVGDVVMAKAETAFLAAARARGCQTQIGLDTLFKQIPAYLEFFGFPSTTPEKLREVAYI